jgi:nitrogen fixation protein NifQ
MNAILNGTSLSRDAAYVELLQHASAVSQNGDWMAQIMASWRAGFGALPDCLGLSERDYGALLACYFPGLRYEGTAPSGRRADFSRMLERQDLCDFLLARSREPGRPESRWMTEIIVAACLGDDHLWQDLGLWSRRDLSALLAHNFPAVAEANDRDMKWKKFLYKQLCAAEGIYVCRAPSCEVCSDYLHCFGPEEAAPPLSPVPLPAPIRIRR